MTTQADTLSLQNSRTFLNTYIRINTFAYGTNGFDDIAPRNAFYDEVSAVLTKIGFKVEPPKFSGACPEGNRGAEHLYCHPHHLNGYVAEGTVEEVKQAIAGAKTFTLRWVDTYERVFNYTEAEFLQALEEQRDEIEAKIIDQFKTKRRNLYMYGNALYRVHSNLQFFKTGVIGATTLEKIEAKFIGDLFQDLLKQGKILSAEKQGRSLYRARTPKDN